MNEPVGPRSTAPAAGDLEIKDAATDLFGGLGRPGGAVRPRPPAVPARVHLARRGAWRRQGHQHAVHRGDPRHHGAADRGQRPADQPAGRGHQERRQDGRRPRGDRPAVRGTAFAAVPRRRHHRRLPADDGAGGMPENALPPHAGTARRVPRHAAGAPLPQAHVPHRAAVRERGGQRRSAS